MTKKQIGRCCAFVLVVCLLLVFLSDLFELENTTNYDKRFYTYRTLESNTVDAIVIGTSGIDRYYVAPKAFEEHGLSVYTLSTDAMPSWLYIDVIEYACRKQDLKLVVVDMRAFRQNNTKSVTVDARGRRVIDAMDFFSLSRTKAAFKTMEVMHAVSDENPRFDLSYLLPYIKFHSKWEEEYSIANNLGSKEHLYGGFFMSSRKSLKKQEQSPLVYDNDVYEDLDPIAEESLYELLDYAEKKGLELLFVDTPHYKDDSEMARSNTLQKILKERGMNYVNYCQTNENGDFLYDLNLDHNNDFYNDAHVNYYGAEKFTDVFARYLVENYDLPDRRQDEAAQKYWNGIYAKIKRDIEKWEKDA
ncbi:MAG: hypothetical protein IKY33_03145 [Clostridia bacterium]|nr:hypothetical protein [Clostridia bacterium]